MRVKVISLAGDVLRLSAEGRVGSEPNGQRMAGDPLQTLLGPEVYARKVLLGLEDADYCDSVGVGWLLSSHRRFREGGGMLVLHSVPPLIMQTLKVMQLDKLFHLASDEKAAIALVQNGTPA